MRLVRTICMTGKSSGVSWHLQHENVPNFDGSTDLASQSVPRDRRDWSPRPRSTEPLHSTSYSKHARTAILQSSWSSNRSTISSFGFATIARAKSSCVTCRSVNGYPSVCNSVSSPSGNLQHRVGEPNLPQAPRGLGFVRFRFVPSRRFHAASHEIFL